MLTALAEDVTYDTIAKAMGEANHLSAIKAGRKH
ncbi:MAG: hypothetical protein QOJ33_2186 [Chloroflexota bacterium]|nr:hypothetical protein [Chloroflexota bacterium]